MRNIDHNKFATNLNNKSTECSQFFGAKERKKINSNEIDCMKMNKTFHKQITKPAYNNMNGFNSSIISNNKIPHHNITKKFQDNECTYNKGFNKQSEFKRSKQELNQFDNIFLKEKSPTSIYINRYEHASYLNHHKPNSFGDSYYKNSNVVPENNNTNCKDSPLSYNDYDVYIKDKGAITEKLGKLLAMELDKNYYNQEHDKQINSPSKDIKQISMFDEIISLEQVDNNIRTLSAKDQFILNPLYEEKNVKPESFLSGSNIIKEEANYINMKGVNMSMQSLSDNGSISKLVNDKCIKVGVYPKAIIFDDKANDQQHGVAIKKMRQELLLDNLGDEINGTDDWSFHNSSDFQKAIINYGVTDQNTFCKDLKVFINKRQNELMNNKNFDGLFNEIQKDFIWRTKEYIKAIKKNNASSYYAVLNHASSMDAGTFSQLYDKAINKDKQNFINKDEIL